MRTTFTTAQLADPHLADVERNLRSCVHCGICTATCPTYVLLGDERDGPRGRIVMIQQMLEEGATPSAEAVLHIDRCLSCLACRTACPSSVDYARLVDAARSHVEKRYRRPLAERLLRSTIANVLTRPALARVGMTLAPLGRLLPGRLGTMARLAAGPLRHRRPRPLPAQMGGARRIAVLPGCVQAVLAPQIDEAVAHVLARRGFEPVTLDDAGCCGSLVHHLGKDARRWAQRLIEAFERAGGAESFEAVLISATGCSAYLKDLAHLFAGDPEWAHRAATFSDKVKDLLELIGPAETISQTRLRVAWQAPCSLQNGLKLAEAGKKLLARSGFDVIDIPEAHLCCGSAGSYSILQPEIAARLRARKLGNIAGLRADVIATANIGCLHHLAGRDAPPIVHYAELIDWAEGGATPAFLAAGNLRH